MDLFLHPLDCPHYRGHRHRGRRRAQQEVKIPGHLCVYVRLGLTVLLDNHGRSILFLATVAYVFHILSLPIGLVSPSLFKLGLVGCHAHYTWPATSRPFALFVW